MLIEVKQIRQDTGSHIKADPKQKKRAEDGKRIVRVTGEIQQVATQYPNLLTRFVFASVFNISHTPSSCFHRRSSVSVQVPQYVRNVLVSYRSTTRCWPS